MFHCMNYHTWFIHSSVDVQLGLFLLFLSFEWCSHQRSCTSFCAGACFRFPCVPRTGVLGHTVTLFNHLTIWGTAKLFSKVVAPVHIPTFSHKYEGSDFSTSLPTLVFIGLFDSSHPSRCEVVFLCDFDLHFPDD